MASCNKNEDIINDTVVDQDSIVVSEIIESPGCYIQNMLSADLDFQYSFHYSTGFETILEKTKLYNSTTGQVNESYRYVYYINEVLHMPILDTVYKYLGDVDNTDFSNWETATVFRYSFFDDTHYEIEAADVFINAPEVVDGGFLLKGTIYYEYDDFDLLTGVEYVDYVDNIDSGTEHDNYRMVIIHDVEERFRELHYYNWNDVETYYEIHEPSSYYQPTQISKSFHPEHGWLIRFAPQTSIYWTQGVGMVSYNYEYQVNDKNYVVEQTWNDGFNTYTASLFNYHCYD